MSAENDEAAGAATEQMAQGGKYTLHKVYVKDCSFECPNGPEIFRGSWKPQFSVQLNTTASELSPDTREVVLGVTVDAKLDDKTAFLAEVQQAGIFSLTATLSPEDQQHLLSIECPTVLYPYAREAVSELVAKGGFPQLLLQPVSFEDLFAQQGTEGAAAGDGSPGAAES